MCNIPEFTQRIPAAMRHIKNRMRTARRLCDFAADPNLRIRMFDARIRRFGFQIRTHNARIRSAGG